MYEETVHIDRLEHAVSLFGSYDENVKLLERTFRVNIITRSSEIKIAGEEESVRKTVRAINSMLAVIRRGDTLSEQSIRYCISLVEDNIERQWENTPDECICITSKGKPVKPKTIGQSNYVKAIAGHSITFGVGPAGTGKTYLAVAMAVAAFRRGEVERIILTRPAVEAGEKLGFLPGDLQSKIDPYLRPLYDALFDMLGAESYQRYLERGTIEVAPLAYMRGRTLDDSFIILDEAQNPSRDQMKLFLTRHGFRSKMVINGDVTQIDLPDGKKSGLSQVIRILDGIEDIAVVRFDGRDVVRHRLVQDIIRAYEKSDEREKNDKAAASKKAFRRTIK